MAYIDGNEVLFSAQVNITGSGDVDMSNYYTTDETYNKSEIDYKLEGFEESTWDLVITAEKLEGTNLNSLLASASGRVFVKAIDNSATINVRKEIKLIEFAPSVVFNGNVDIIGSDDANTDYKDDCQVIRGARNSETSPSDTSGSETPKIKNFKGGVEHCHGEGWFIEDCNNIEHCTYLGINNCKNISHCNIGKGFGYFGGDIYIKNSTDIEDLYTTDETMGGWKFKNCKFVRDIMVGGYCSFEDCDYIANIYNETNGSARIDYTNCNHVNPYTCDGFLTDEDVGKVQALTKDGSFATIPNAEGVSF